MQPGTDIFRSYLNWVGREAKKTKQIEKIKWIFFNLFVSAHDAWQHSAHSVHEADRREKCIWSHWLVSHCLLSAPCALRWFGRIFISDKKKSIRDMECVVFAAGCAPFRHQPKLVWLQVANVEVHGVHFEPSTQQIDADALHQVDILREQTYRIRGRRLRYAA